MIFCVKSFFYSPKIYIKPSHVISVCVEIDNTLKKL